MWEILNYWFIISVYILLFKSTSTNPLKMINYKGLMESRIYQIHLLLESFRYNACYEQNPDDLQQRKNYNYSFSFAWECFMSNLTPFIATDIYDFYIYVSHICFIS